MVAFDGVGNYWQRVRKLSVAAWILLSAASLKTGCKPSSPPSAPAQKDASPLQLDWSKPAAGCAGVPAGILDSKSPTETIDPEGAEARGKAKNSATRVVDGMRGAFRACYKGFLGRHPHAEGTVQLQLFVDCDGSVTSIHAEARGVDEQAVRCVMETARQGQFESPADGAAEIRVPQRFVDQHPDAGVQPPLDGSP